MSNSRGKRPSQQLVDAPEGDDPRMQVTPDLAAWITERASQPRLNAYKCEACGRIMVTRDLHAGVTPMFLDCRTTEGCQGTAASAGYPSGPMPEGYPPVTLEWYRPSATELERMRTKARDRNPLTGQPTDRARMEAAMVDHVMRGGLALRDVTPLRAVPD